MKKVLEGLEDEEATINMTDPEAPVMTHKDARKLRSYNHQSATDGKYGLVCAVARQDEGDKSANLFELVDQARENTGKAHEAVLADPGFCDYEALQKVAEERKEECFLPDKRFEVAERQKEIRDAYDNSRFRRCEDGSLMCPEGQVMRLRSVERFDDGHTRSMYEGTACQECRAREKCTKGERRRVSIDSREPYREMMREKLRSDRGR